MCGEHDVFIFKGRVAAGDFGDQVGRLYFGDLDFCLRFERNGEGEMWQQFAIFTEGRNFCEAMAGAGKKFFGARGIDGDGELGACGFVELGIVEIHADMSAVERDARPGDVHGSGVDQGNGPDSACGAQHFPTLGRGLVMRSQSPGNLGGRSGEDHDDLAADIDACKVVIVCLGNFETVANENQRRFHFWIGHDAGTDGGIFTKRKRLAFAVTDECKAAIFLDDLAGYEFDGLIEAVGARRHCARIFELLDCIGLRGALAATAGIAAFEFIVGENFDAIPPSLAVEMRSLSSGENRKWKREQ
jgi:hypothetical protein